MRPRFAVLTAVAAFFVGVYCSTFVTKALEFERVPRAYRDVDDLIEFLEFARYSHEYHAERPEKQGTVKLIPAEQLEIVEYYKEVLRRLK